MPGMFNDRSDAMFSSMIEENHCAPPAAFETKPMPLMPASVALQGKSQEPFVQEGSNIAPRTLGESSSTQYTGPSTSMSSTAEGDLGMSAASIIRPNRGALPSNMEIHVHGIPPTGAKSRVETQIRMRIELVTPATNLEDGNKTWERIGSFAHIKVPPLSGTKRKSKKHQKTNVPNDTLLLLEAEVVNATPPHSRVYVCNSCRERERKRADRKKSKKLYSTSLPTAEEMNAMNIDPNAPNAYELAAERMGEEERKHAVLFNCGDYIDFHDGEAVISTRITCYCRHHREKVGFRIVFTLRDSRGDFIATGSTPPIMIMDDHKSVTQTGAAARPVRIKGANRAVQENPGEGVIKAMSLSPKASHPVTTSELPTRARDRAKPYDDRRRFRSGKDQGVSAPIDSSSMSFVLDPNHNFMWNTLAIPENAPEVSTSNVALAQHMQDPASMQRGSMSPSSVADSAKLLTTPLSVEPLPPSQASDVPFEPVFSSPTQSHGTQQECLPGLEGSTLPDTEPRITKLIPAEGPTSGGIEITVLGENLTEGLQCVFGDTPCSHTRVWASTTLVCILPPRFRPGPVIVSLQRGPTNPGPPIANQPLQLFTYIDATDRALMELALQVVGLQMTGQMASARDIAMRIVNSSQNEGSNRSGFDGSVPQNQAADGTPDVSALLAYGLRLCQSHNVARPSVQDSIIGFLSLLDVTVSDKEQPQQDNGINAVHACNSRGHTLLHLAVLSNCHRLVVDLLRRGCPVNAQDVNGYTALHFAALLGSLLTTRVLLEHGASPYIHSLDSLQPIDVARRSEMIDTENVLAEHMPDAVDQVGWSNSSDSEDESEDSDSGEEQTPLVGPRAEFENTAVSDGDSDTESSVSSDAGISFAELAAIQRMANETSVPTETPSSPRHGWPFGLLRRRSPVNADEEKRDTKKNSSLWPDLNSTAPQSPRQIHSPPPTYDEATLDDESSTSRHVFGEKLVTGADDSVRLHQRLRADEASRVQLRKRRGVGSEARQRSRTSRERRTAKEGDEINPVVRPRPGVYDDRMLLWFWIPAMVFVFLITVVIHYGPFLYHNTPVGRVLLST